MWSGMYREGNLSSLHVSMKNVLLSLLGLVALQPTHDQKMMMMMMVSRCPFRSYVARLVFLDLFILCL